MLIALPVTTHACRSGLGVPRIGRAWIFRGSRYTIVILPGLITGYSTLR